MSASRELRPCGTVAAHRRHKRNGEKPCEPCRQAAVQAESQRMRGLRRRIPFKLQEGRGPIVPYQYRARRYRWAERVLAASEERHGKPEGEAA